LPSISGATSNFNLAGRQAFARGPGAGLEIEPSAFRVEGADLGQGGVKVLDHRLGATGEQTIELVTTGQRQTNFAAESCQARLFKGGHGGGAFALQGVANAPAQRVSAQLSFDQVIGGAGLHRLHVDLVLARPGKQDDRRLATAVQGGAQQINAVAGAQTVVDQADIVLVESHCVQPLLKSLDPVQSEALAGHVGEEIASDDVIILVIFNQQNFDQTHVHNKRL